MGPPVYEDSENMDQEWAAHPNSTILGPNAMQRGDGHPDSKVHGANMGPSGADRTQVGPMLAPWTLLSGQT